MSDALKLGNLKFGFPAGAALLSGAGRAGPRRLAMIAVVGITVAGLVVAVATSGRHAPPFSRDARMKSVDALPGGLHSTPEQDALAREADADQAQAALARGRSYTPPIAPSVSVVGPSPQPEQATPEAPTASPPNPQSQPRHVGRPPPPVYLPAAVFPPAMPTPRTESVRAVQVAAVVDPKVEAAYTKQIDDLFSQWGGRAPQTEMVLPTTQQTGDGASGDGPDPVSSSGHTRGAATPKMAPAHGDEASQVLIPAGRGVYAHPVLALSSDQSSPVVLQADSGPIAGDRMIGSFARENDRLVIHVNSIIHDGETLGADGVVIAPDTMEASVATGVDQHYLARFILPAAAAFVQGLGQALATTSNTTAVLSPLGGATTTTHLNLDQQLGVGAGVAAAQVASTLNQAAPKGPTVTLEANVAVGVMFLSPVTLHHGG